MKHPKKATTLTKEQIVTARYERGVTQIQLASETGLSYGLICSIERGAPITPRSMGKLLTWYNKKGVSK